MPSIQRDAVSDNPTNTPRNRLNTVVVGRIMEVLHGEHALVDLLLSGRLDAVNLLHQVADRLAHLQETLLAPPLGLVGVQTSASALLEDVARHARLSHTLRVEQLRRVEVGRVDVGDALDLRSNRTAAHAAARGDATRRAIVARLLEGRQSRTAAHARHLLARQETVSHSSHLVAPVQHAQERSDREDSVLLAQRPLERVRQLRDSGVVALVAPLTPLGDAVFVGGVPVAVQLPVDVLEAHVDEMHHILVDVAVLLRRHRHTRNDVVVVADALDVSHVLHDALVRSLAATMIGRLGTTIQRTQDRVHTKEVVQLHRLQERGVRLRQRERQTPPGKRTSPSETYP